MGWYRVAEKSAWSSSKLVSVFSDNMVTNLGKHVEYLLRTMCVFVQHAAFHFCLAVSHSVCPHTAAGVSVAQCFGVFHHIGGPFSGRP